MANKKIRQLSNLNRVMTGTDCIAVDTGSATAKVYPVNIKAGVLRDSDNGTDMKVSFNHAYLTPGEQNLYLVGAQRDTSDSNVPLFATVQASTAKTMLDVSKVSSVVIDQPSLTIGNEGYVAITIPSSGTPLFAIVTTWSTMSGAKTALAIAGTGSSWYLTGTPGVTVTGMKVRYFFVS